jgi:hypothetical protein
MAFLARVAWQFLLLGLPELVTATFPAPRGFIADLGVAGAPQ